MAIFRSLFATAVLVLGFSGCTPVEVTPTGHNSPPGNSPPTTANAAPTLMGAPISGIAAGTTYIFQPTATDADGDALVFSITGKPEWATFDPLTGVLTGTPGIESAGTYTGIVVTVSDGETTRSLSPFSIIVTAPSSGTGTATLRWTAPVEYSDGSAINPGDLAAYRIYHGNSVERMAVVAEVSGDSSSTHTVLHLPPGTHYFAVTAVTTAGAESAWSEIGVKTIL